MTIDRRLSEVEARVKPADPDLERRRRLALAEGAMRAAEQWPQHAPYYRALAERWRSSEEGGIGLADLPTPTLRALLEVSG